MIARVTAPVRICDCGGWTDTWFARHGAVLHVAVLPGVEVRAEARAGEAGVRIRLDSYGESYRYDPARPPGRHPLIEAAVAEFSPSEPHDLDLEIRSDIPPGASTGTSAAVTVAVVASLAALVGGPITPAAAARAAHAIETVRLGLESGIQDQVAAAYGGVNFIQITEYPEATVTPLRLAPEVRRRLDAQLALVYLGRAHRSSDVHRAVIDGLKGGSTPRALDDLRRAAVDARDGLLAGDLAEFGGALRRNVDAQSRLHPSLVSAEARVAGGLAERLGALGWKVNGAGGDGGSVAILFDDQAAQTKAEFSARLPPLLPAARMLPIRVADRGAVSSLV